MRYPENATPLIVFGRPRAGTRYMVGALNKFPEIAVQGELPNPVMQNVKKFVEDAERYYSQRAVMSDARQNEIYQQWLNKKQELLFSMWANAGKSNVVKARPDCKYFGYKRPNHECYFSFYEEHFAKRKPVYVYCIRNFVDNFLSISSRWPERKIRQVAGEYLESIKQYWKIRQSAPDRLLTFVLDEHVEQGSEYLERKVISQLDVIATPEIMKAIAGMAPKNTTVGLNVARRTALTSKEERFVARNPELRGEFERLLGQ